MASKFRVFGPRGDLVLAGLREQEATQPIVRSLDDALELGDISCVDADGNVFERYRRLSVRKDIYRNADGSQRNFTPYDGAVYCEENGMFEPSFALSCNILAALWRNKNDALANHVLMQYKDKGNGYGWHTQNTVVDFGRSEVIHYPTAGDFGKKGAVNAKRCRVALPFDKSRLCDSNLEGALRNNAARRYIQQLTGSKEPEVLVEIGNYFGKPARLWFSWSGQNGGNYSETRAAWLGCYDYVFLLSADDILSDSSAVRGVRRSEP